MPRPSAAQAAIRGVLADSRVHALTLDELRGRLAAAGSPADSSTVFRAVEALARDGAVRRVDLGDGRARVEALAAHHEHVRCDGCGEVTAVPGCLVDDVRARVAASTGYAVTDHLLVLVGRCPACRTAAR